MGPGRGESIVAHVGNGEWLIVDSCRDSSDGTVAPLRYLRDIGVDPATQVVMIAATHWHDDHVSGISEIVRECPRAKFCCPVAFTKREFLAFVTAHDEIKVSELTSATKEIVRVLEILRERGTRPVYIGPDRTLHTCRESGVSAISLSPDDRRIEKFLSMIASMIPVEKSEMRRAVGIAPNEIAAAMILTLPGDSILLGADLEEEGIRGWTAVLENSQCISGRSSIFKVPHHGSPNGHCDAVWRDALVETDPIAVLTPFNRGDVHIPGRDDADRILALTDRAYCTSTMIANAPAKLDPSVERTLRESGIRRSSVDAKFGQVRIRKPLRTAGGEWTVETIRAAVHLRHAHSRATALG